MHVDYSETQVVGETLAKLWGFIGASPISLLVLMKNSGMNTMNYNIQEWTGSAWMDLGAVGTPFNNTLSPNQVLQLIVVSNNSRIQVLGNASGGAFLEFSVKTYFNRQSGGDLPLLNL